MKLSAYSALGSFSCPLNQLSVREAEFSTDEDCEDLPQFGVLNAIDSLYSVLNPTGL